MRIKGLKKRQGRYIPLEDIEDIDDKYLAEMERVKQRLSYVKDEAIIEAFQTVLLNSYNAAIEICGYEREVDYEIKLAKINERRRNLKPWRRCWLWRLLFQPVTNRAQDIIEAGAELEADTIHTDEEKKIEDKRKQLPADSSEKLTKRKLKREMKKQLNAVINKADNADVNEVFNEPSGAPPVEENPDTRAPGNAGQLPGQMQMQLNALQQTPARRPRPPRSCRKP